MTVAIVMPTIPARAKSAQAAIKRLLPQTDRLYVHLDGYSSIPSWLPSSARCFVHRENQGSVVRYSVVPDETYTLFVDDDLNYPSNYVASSLAHLHRLGNRRAVAWHGAWWPQGALPHFRQRVLLSYWDANDNDRELPYIGAGTLVLRTKDLCTIDRAAPPQFRAHCDVWTSSALARADIKCFRPPSAKLWIGKTAAGEQGVFTAARRDGFKQRDACIAAALALGSWRLTP